MARDSVRAALQLLAGAGEITCAKAQDAAFALLDLPATAAGSGRAGELTTQVAALAEELFAAATANRQLVQEAVRAELDARLAVLGLARAAELRQAQAEIDSVHHELDDLRAALLIATERFERSDAEHSASGEPDRAASDDQPPRAGAAPAKKAIPPRKAAVAKRPAASRAEVRKAAAAKRAAEQKSAAAGVAKEPVREAAGVEKVAAKQPDEATAAAKKASARKTAAATTPAKKTPVATSTPAKKTAAAKKAAVAKTPAKKTAATKSAPTHPATPTTSEDPK